MVTHDLRAEIPLCAISSQVKSLRDRQWLHIISQSISSLRTSHSRFIVNCHARSLNARKIETEHKINPLELGASRLRTVWGNIQLHGFETSETSLRPMLLAPSTRQRARQSRASLQTRGLRWVGITSCLRCVVRPARQKHKINRNSPPNLAAQPAGRQAWSVEEEKDITSCSGSRWRSTAGRGGTATARCRRPPLAAGRAPPRTAAVAAAAGPAAVVDAVEMVADAGRECQYSKTLSLSYSFSAMLL